MGTNYERLLHIISKWPVDINKKGLDYGHHLRQLIKNKNLEGNFFPGTSAENSKMLDSLLRLLKNVHKHTYPCNLKHGASGYDEKSIEEFLNNDVKIGYAKKEE